MGNAAGNFIKGFGFGAAGLLGFRDQVDPLSKKRAALADQNKAIQEIYNVNTLSALQKGQEISKQLYRDLTARSGAVKAYVDFNNELIWESIAEDNLFIIILFILVLIVIFFSLFT